MLKKQWSDWVWDIWCICSGIGIWPRYIEPRLLEVTRLVLPIRDLPAELAGLKIIHFSDLHWSNQFSTTLQKKLIQKINAAKPDLIFFTGDFLCRSELEDPEGLIRTLGSLKAQIGSFAVLGNHDYASFVTVNAQGDYDVDAPSTTSNISKGFKRLFHSVSLTKRVTAQAQQIGYHAALMDLLKQTPFQILNNATKLISCKGSWINICGLEEYSLGRFNPDVTFKGYDERYPGIVLSHNPDSLEILKRYPGDIILSGHTHGGQVNLPVMWNRFTRMENPCFKKGLKKIIKKWAYINRGISSVMRFRWFAAPELTLLTLQKGSI